MRYLISRFLGVILCGLSVIPMLPGEVLAVSILFEDSEVDSVQRSSALNDNEKRRDPFHPIKKQRLISSASRKSRSPSPRISAISTFKGPNWKLLGIIQGQFGRLAVIQTLSGERMFVEPGLEPVREGWIIKTISDTEVHLEHASSSAKGKSVAQSKTFVLSFPTLGKTS